MSILFQVFIMWTLYALGYAPFGLTLGFTIAIGVGQFLRGISAALNEKKGVAK